MSTEPNTPSNNLDKQDGNKDTFSVTSPDLSLRDSLLSQLSREARDYILAAPMTKIALRGAGMVGVLMFLLLITVGCQTTPRKATYQTIGTVVTAVDVAKNVYYDWRNKQKMLPARTEARMKEAYLKYQSVMRGVETAYKVTSQAQLSGMPSTGELASVAQTFIDVVAELTGATSLPRLEVPVK